MKKYFTLIAAMLMTVGAYAQTADTLFTASAKVYLPGLDQEATRTIVALSDSTFTIKAMYGEGSGDVVLKVDATGHVDFAGATMDASFYTYCNIAGSSEVTQLWAYCAYYYSYTTNNNGDYYQLPGKQGGELIISYTGAYNGSNSAGAYNQMLYVCWGKIRVKGTKDWAGVAHLVGTPAVAGTLDGNWATTDKASIGFYYDEIKGDTVYRINNWYGADQYFHFRTTSEGYVSPTSSYLYTGDATVDYLYVSGGNYTYTYGDGAYYVQDLTKVRNGEIGFFAYAYDYTYTCINYYSADWQKNYYTFDWENTDIAATALQATERVQNAQTTVKTRDYIIKNGVKYNYMGQKIK